MKIVYAHDRDSPNKQRKAQELIFSGMRATNGLISAQVLSKFFITITRKIENTYSVPVAKHEIMLLAYLEVVDIDYDLVLCAVGFQDTYRINYWDGLILAAAERADCDTYVIVQHKE